MREIALSQGLTAMVDDDDYDWLSQWKWYASVQRMHRVILAISDSKVYVDHADHNGLNNQRANLRSCANYQNQHNRIKYVPGTSRYKGVKLKRGRWCAHIKILGKETHLGYFANEDDAGRAYNAAAMTYFGEFALPNEIS